MFVRFVTAEDRDTSAAPLDGDLYVDSVLGSERNSGASPDKPKRFLPQALSGASKIYLRGGQIHRRNKTPLAPTDEEAFRADFGGTEISPAEIVSWGGERALLAGDSVVRWGPVESSHGNAYLAANGEELEHSAASLWNPHFVGFDPLLPCYWSPACPDDLSQVSRHAFSSIVEGAHANYTEPKENVQGKSYVSYPASESRDSGLAAESSSVTMSTEESGEMKQTTLYFKHPAIATHYGDTDGPIGAIVSWRGHPSNGEFYAWVTGYDYANSTIIAKTLPDPDGHWLSNDIAGCRWRIWGHPFDLRQPGQYASIQGRAWRVRGDWRRGESTMATFNKVAWFRGNHYISRGIDYGRAAGQPYKNFTLDVTKPLQESIRASIFTGYAESATFDNTEFREQLSYADSKCFNRDSSSIAYGSLTMTDVSVRDVWSTGFINAVATKYHLDGVTFEGLGKTFIYNTSTAGIGEQTFKNIKGRHSFSTHGNGISSYKAAKNVEVDGYTALGCTRPYTQQLAGGSFDPPQNNQITNLLVIGQREINTSPGAAIKSDASYLRSDSGFDGCLIDRALIADGGNVEINGSGTNNGGIVKRSAVPAISASQSDGWAGDDGPNVLFQDVVAGGATTPESKGGDSDNFDLEARPDWNGAIDEAAWRKLTIDSGRTGYESIDVGDRRDGWTIPAYDDSDPQPGVPVALKLEFSRFYNNTQAGDTVDYVLRARPMSLLSLPAGVADNDKFLLDQGRIVAGERLTAASYTVVVDEQTQAKSGGTWSPSGAAKRNTFEIKRVM